jgi:hypothetical protein
MVDHVFGDVSLPRLIATLAADEAGRVLGRSSARDLDLDDATKVRRSAIG